MAMLLGDDIGDIYIKDEEDDNDDDDASNGDGKRCDDNVTWRDRSCLRSMSFAVRWETLSSSIVIS